MLDKPTHAVTATVPDDETIVVIAWPTVFFAKLVDAIDEKIGVQIKLEKYGDGAYSVVARRSPRPH